MFAILAVLLAFGAAYFGAVLPQAYLGMAIFWAIATAVVLVVRCAESRRLDADSVLLLVCLVGLPSLIGIKSAVAVYGLPWAWVATRRSRSPLTFLHFLLVLGILEALLGLVQYLVSPGWMILYTNRVSVSSGTLINRNHFAGLLEMLIPVSFGLAYINARSHGETARSYLYLLAGAFMGLALLLSLSRMGIASFLISVASVCLLVSAQGGARRLAVVLGATLGGLVIIGGLWVGLDALFVRYDDLLHEPGAADGGRAMLYQETLRLIRDNPGGIGPGNYKDYFRRYQTSDLEALYDHAHNDYLETSAEWGLPTAALFWLLVLAALTKCLNGFLRSGGDPVRAGILLACAGSLIAILLHSLVDFNLQIPSNALLFSALTGTALAVGARAEEREHSA